MAENNKVTAGPAPEIGRVEATRDTIIEALSWSEDLDTGRWGYDRAATLLDDYVRERVALELLATADDIDALANPVAPDADFYSATAIIAYLRKRALSFSPSKA